MIYPHRDSADLNAYFASELIRSIQTACDGLALSIQIKVDSALSEAIPCELMSEPRFGLLPDLTQAMGDAATGAAELAAAELAAAIAELQFGDFHQRWDAAKRLPGLGDIAIEPLLNLLPTAADDGELLWFLARVLGNFQHPAAVAALVKLLESSPDPEIVAMAATALVNFGEAALPALTNLLKQPSTSLIALQALAQIQHPSVLVALLEAATDSSAEVRAAAISALSQVQASQVQALGAAESCWAAFWTGLGDPAATVRRAAVMALGARAEQGMAAVRAAALVAAIRPLLADVALEVQRQAALALGRIGSEAAVDLLGAALHELQDKSQNPASGDLQIEVLRALAWTEQPAALAQIQQYLNRRHADSAALEQEMVAVLGRVTVCGAAAAQILFDLLASAHPIAQTVRGKQQIALSLGQLQQAEAIDPLIELLADPTLSVRLHATAALKQLAAQGAAARMQQRLGQPDGSAALQAGIATALQELSRLG